MGFLESTMVETVLTVPTTLKLCCDEDWSSIPSLVNRYLYRAYDRETYTGSMGKKITVTIAKIPVIKNTEKGAWVRWDNKKHFVLNDARKKFAYDTEEEALKAYWYRKRKHLQILTSQLTKIRYIVDHFAELEQEMSRHAAERHAEKCKELECLLTGEKYKAPQKKRTYL